ncbi:hypothetical protein BAZOLSSOX_2616, partial [uncultured Gammaproteobacteria bacterium]
SGSEGGDKIKGHPTRRQVIWSLCSDPLLGRDEVTRTNRGAEGINSRVKFLPLAWAGMPKTSFRKNSDSPHLFDSHSFVIDLTTNCIHIVDSFLTSAFGIHYRNHIINY